jgi:hypothetical protein
MSTKVLIKLSFQNSDRVFTCQIQKPHDLAEIAKKLPIGVHTLAVFPYCAASVSYQERVEVFPGTFDQEALTKNFGGPDNKQVIVQVVVENGPNGNHAKKWQIISFYDNHVYVSDYLESLRWEGCETLEASGRWIFD